MQNTGGSYPFSNVPLLQPTARLPQSLARPRQLFSGPGNMEIGGLLNVRAAGGAQMGHHYQQHPMQMDHRSYSMGQPQPNLNHHQQQQQIPNPAMAYQPMQPLQQQTQMYSSSYETRDESEEQIVDGDDEFGATRPKVDDSKKQFNCSTCPKAFARRSDLARHERIHSGIRPHACDHPNCGKRFIQRSALTVHQRVHTGIKPHMCERCSKPFSDSSSLARHRRIHSGKRPYKCPFANCQKTFTRRTTLTRHQNHHTGTVEQAAAETSAKLSGSSASSRNSTASPAERTISPSPGQELPSLVKLERSASDYGYLPPNPHLPPHMRNDYQHQPLPRSNPSMNGPSLTNFTSAPQTQMSPTSHPAAYGPPQPLEPPANGTASGSASPHMGPLGWGSPRHGGLPSPGSMGNFDYPDPGFGGPALYYPHGPIRRPQSTEPEDYGIRPRGSHAANLANNLANHVPMTADWSSMPVNMDHQHRQERYVM